MIVKACALALLIALCAFVLRELGWRGAPLFCIIGALGIITLILPDISEAVSLFSSLSDEYGASEAGRSVLKIIGVGYLGGVCSDICRDMGEGGAASAVVLVTRVEIIAIALPHFLNIIRLGGELIV